MITDVVKFNYKEKLLKKSFDELRWRKKHFKSKTINECSRIICDQGTGVYESWTEISILFSY